MHKKPHHSDKPKPYFDAWELCKLTESFLFQLVEEAFYVVVENKSY